MYLREGREGEGSSSSNSSNSDGIATTTTTVVQVVEVEVVAAAAAASVVLDVVKTAHSQMIHARHMFTHFFLTYLPADRQVKSRDSLTHTFWYPTPTLLDLLASSPETQTSYGVTAVLLNAGQGP